MPKLPNLRVNVGGIEMKNPVVAASGTFGYGLEFSRFVDLSRLGAFVTKGVSSRPWPGNRPARIVETRAGMLNAIGLQNVGIEAFLTDKLPRIRKLDTAIIVNIVGREIDEYVAVAKKLSGQDGVAGIELNISCPNIKQGGISFGQNPNLSAEVTQAVKNAAPKKPLIVKLTPNVTDVAAIALAVERGGADAVSLINTLTGMAIDIDARRPVLANITGGLSGPAIKPVALRMVWQVARTVKIPVIGIGGISCWQDAVEFLIAGATAVAVGTANFINPKVTIEIIEGIERYLVKHKMRDVYQLIGSLVTDEPNTQRTPDCCT
ncbi:MAG: dihydroorotate dehydrogenase [Candidatus Abyssobacteria bacterium SURF_17]|uniref:Dihydroorotate dehydrogenase n=1 Tax=Candidatus Abyssobacteria bacterium SURF_17 TaxID=2093361 RepID=A0A419F9W4_9BACT|nr:MAG: dihydroorotate dehydrogenase [Candidatus Abyssubacteria bacterium SURF_17]